jgi:hypothetical protein
MPLGFYEHSSHQNFYLSAFHRFVPHLSLHKAALCGCLHVTNPGGFGCRKYASCFLSSIINNFFPCFDNVSAQQDVRARHFVRIIGHWANVYISRGNKLDAKNL